MKEVTRRMNNYNDDIKLIILMFWNTKKLQP